MKFTDPRNTQDFQALRDYWLEKKSEEKSLYEDPEFPATNSSRASTASPSLASTISFPEYNTDNDGEEKEFKRLYPVLYELPDEKIYKRATVSILV